MMLSSSPCRVEATKTFSLFRNTLQAKEKRKIRMSERNRVGARFSELAKKGECALICYVVAGYPDARTSQAIIEMLIQGGADVIEIGIPFSDPIADGPTIQAASHAS